MKNAFAQHLKKILCSGLFCAGIHYAADSSIITKHDLEYHVRQTAEQFLADEGFGAFYIPSRLQSDYEQKLQAAKQELLTLLTRRGRSYLDIDDVKNTLHQTMRPFADNLRSVVHDFQLEAALTSAIQSYLATKGLTQDSIPDRDVAEFINRSGTITNKLQAIMRNDRRSYVRVFEIEKEIDNALNIFVRRISKNQFPQYNSTYQNRPQNTGVELDWFSQFFNPQPKPAVTSTTAATTPKAQKVMSYDLEQSVTNAAYSILRTHNIDPNKVPARAVAEYSAKVQKALNALKNIMSNAGRNYVWKDELEQTMLAELQSVVDKIHYKGESCSICLDDYSKGNRVGVLSCGHNYHKDCIYQWLGMNKSCPLCRETNVIVAQIETVL